MDRLGDVAVPLMQRTCACPSMRGRSRTTTAMAEGQWRRPWLPRRRDIDWSQRRLCTVTRRGDEFELRVHTLHHRCEPTCTQWRVYSLTAATAPMTDCGCPNPNRARVPPAAAWWNVHLRSVFMSYVICCKSHQRRANPPRRGEPCWHARRGACMQRCALWRAGMVWHVTVSATVRRGY